MDLSHVPPINILCHDNISLARVERVLMSHRVLIVGTSSLLHNLKRVPSHATLASNALRTHSVANLLLHEDIVNLLKSASSSLRAAEPNISRSQEAAHQGPDEDLRANGVNTSAATKDHDPRRQPLAARSKSTSNVSIFERRNLRTVDPRWLTVC